MRWWWRKIGADAIYGFGFVWHKLDTKLLSLPCFLFSPPAVRAELTAPNRTHHPDPGASLTGESLIRSDGFSLQTRPAKTAHPLEEKEEEERHPQRRPRWSETLHNAINATSLNGHNSQCWYWAWHIHVHLSQSGRMDYLSTLYVYSGHVAQSAAIWWR